MEPASDSRDRQMMSVLTVVFLVAAVVTVVVALLLVEPPGRNALFWLTTGFVCLVEVGAYLIAIEPIAGKVLGGRVSVPIIGGSWAVLALLGTVGGLSICIYAMVRDPQHPSDKAFAAILLAETTVAVLVVFFMRGFDRYYQPTERPILERREVHASTAVTLHPLVLRIRNIKWSDPVVMTRADRLVKRLEGIETALAHSHGGGVGSPERGAQHRVDIPAESDARELIAELGRTMSTLEAQIDVETDMKKAEALATRLQGCLSASELL